MTRKQSWPNDYLSWKGRFDDLVETANEILKSQGLSDRPLTPRLLRHYQHIGAVGKGEKNGREAYFSHEDLAAVLAAKGLVKEGFTLNHATTLLNSPPPSQKALNAVDVVNALMQKPSDAPKALVRSAYNSYASSASASPPPSTPPPTNNLWLDPSPWLHIHVRTDQAIQSNPHEKAQAIAVLEELAFRLKKGDLS